MRTRLMVLPLVLSAFAVMSPAHAVGTRVCTISDDGAPGGETNFWKFIPSSITAGDWELTVEGRDCPFGSGAPAAANLSGSYIGDPCVAMVLTGDAIGVITGGAAGTGVGVTHAGPDGIPPGGTFIGIESVHVFNFGGCTPLSTNTVVATAFTVQVQVTP